MNDNIRHVCVWPVGDSVTSHKHIITEYLSVCLCDQVNNVSHIHAHYHHHHCSIIQMHMYNIKYHLCHNNNSSENTTTKALNTSKKTLVCNIYVLNC